VIARVLSAGVRYLARVLDGVSGKKRKPYNDIGSVIRKSMMNSQRLEARLATMALDCNEGDT
jgi:hypothetical protein